MSKNLPTIWPADPHTLAKIEILKAYLHAWVPILGSKFRQPLLYVDGFAGPGRYQAGEDGSPVAAVRASATGMDQIEKTNRVFVSKEMHFFFIEKDTDRHAHLEQTLSGMASSDSRLKIHPPMLASFAEALPNIIQSIPVAFHANAPVFLFADPFGATGMPFSVLRDAVRGDSSELLINLDADGIRRIYQAFNNKREEQLTELFGCEQWKDFDACGNDHQKLHREILALYKKQIRTIPGMKYIWQFGMRGRHDSLNYYLVFASKNPLGLEKMKEAMKKISQNGSYTFSDASVDQDHMMFNLDDDSVYAEQLWNEYLLKKVSFDVVVDYALNETPFTNPKSMLAELERKGRIRVEGKPGRRKCTFPDGEINFIEFVKEPMNPPRNNQMEMTLE